MHVLSIVASGAILATLVALARRKGELSMTLALANIVVFVICLFAVPDIRLGYWGVVQLELGLRPDRLFQIDGAHTLLTHLFMHVDLLHLLFNMLFLLLIGSHLEAWVGKRRFLLIYFLGGLLAALAEALMHLAPGGPQPLVVLVGASGAISALMGAMLLLYPNREIPFFLGPIFLPRVKVWLSVGLWLVIQGVLLMTDHGGGVAYAAHIGGFAAGALIAQLSGHRVTLAHHVAEGPWENLEDLALTPRLRRALQEVRDADEADVMHAWMEHFAENASCPRCGGPLELDGHSISCPCGWSRRVL